MDKDRNRRADDQSKGAMKHGPGAMPGDEKYKAESNADKSKGKPENNFGGAKDGFRDADRDAQKH